MGNESPEGGGGGVGHPRGRDSEGISKPIPKLNKKIIPLVALGKTLQAQGPAVTKRVKRLVRRWWRWYTVGGEQQRLEITDPSL